MTLVEVSSSIFQIIIDLPPGYHQVYNYGRALWECQALGSYILYSMIEM